MIQSNPNTVFRGTATRTLKCRVGAECSQDRMAKVQDESEPQRDESNPEQARGTRLLRCNHQSNRNPIWIRRWPSPRGRRHRLPYRHGRRGSRNLSSSAALMSVSACRMEEVRVVEEVIGFESNLNPGMSPHRKPLCQRSRPRSRCPG